MPGGVSKLIAQSPAQRLPGAIVTARDLASGG